MTLALEGIACDGAEGAGAVACPHVDGIGGVAKVVSTGAWSGLMAPNVVTWWSGETETTSGQGIGEGLEGDGWETKGQAEERGNNASQGVTSQPHISVGVEGGDIVIQVYGGVVIMAFFAQVFDQASRVAGVGRGLAVTNLLPEILTSLATAATSKKVVIHLVVASSVGTVKHGGRCAL